MVSATTKEPKAKVAAEPCYRLIYRSHSLLAEGGMDEAGPTAKRLFGKWAMAIVAEHHAPDMPMVATTGGLAQGAPWKVTLQQDAILTRLRDLTRGYGRGS